MEEQGPGGTRITVRTQLIPGDIGDIISLHGRTYSAEYAWDHRFEAYVAESLGAFAQRNDSVDERIWIAEKVGRIVGCVGIVKHVPTTAQLRWFLVTPDARGVGLGGLLIRDALQFCRDVGYRHVFLWTTSELTAAKHLYETMGFALTEQHESQLWGDSVIEQRYDLLLG